MVEIKYTSTTKTMWGVCVVSVCVSVYGVCVRMCMVCVSIVNMCDWCVYVCVYVYECFCIYMLCV